MTRTASRPNPMTSSREAMSAFRTNIGQGLNFLGLSETQIIRANDILLMGDSFSDEEGNSRYPVIVFSAPTPQGVVFRLQREQMVDGVLHQMEAESAETLDEAVRRGARMLLAAADA